MSCTDEVPSVERKIVLPAPVEEVWESLTQLLGDDVELAAEPGGRLRANGPEGERVRVVEEADAPRRLVFWWVGSDGDASDGEMAPSQVELELTPCETTSGVGTLLHVRETQFDAAEVADGLLRGPLALARA